MEKKISMLGTEYTVRLKRAEEHEKMEYMDGCCDTSIKEIVIALTDAEQILKE